MKCNPIGFKFSNGSCQNNTDKLDKLKNAHARYAPYNKNSSESEWKNGNGQTNHNHKPKRKTIIVHVDRLKKIARPIEYTFSNEDTNNPDGEINRRDLTLYIILL